MTLQKVAMRWRNTTRQTYCGKKSADRLRRPSGCHDSGLGLMTPKIAVEKKGDTVNSIENDLRMGIKAQENRDFAAAADCYQRVLAGEPDHPEANHAVGLLLISNNQSDMAVPFLMRSLQFRPEVEHLWLDCLDALLEVGDWAEANELLGRARARGLSAFELDLRELHILHGLTQQSLGDNKAE